MRGDRRRTISNRMVAALEVERDTVFWDRELKGFGVRAYPGGGRVYVAQARGPKGPRRVTVGRHGVVNAEEAKRRAALIIARVKAGEDPVPEPLAAKLAQGPRVADLAARYLEEHVSVRCKPKTARTSRSVVERHIVPTLGGLSLAAVEPRHVLDLHHGLSDRPAMANMTVAVLSHMYKLAEGWGMVADGVNPCGSVARYPAKRRERFLTDAEFEKLGRVLDEAEVEGGASAGAVAAIRLLMLTGCRKNEILTLRWKDVGPRRGRAGIGRREDRSARGAAAAVGGAAAGRAVPQARQSLGHTGPQAGHAHDRHRRRLADAPGARRAEGRAAS